MIKNKYIDPRFRDTSLCDDEVIVFSTIGKGPKGDKGDKGDAGIDEAAERARKAAEQVRVSSEKMRVNAEQARVTAESARASAEAAREVAESARAIAEQARITAETGRAGAETVRVTVENARVSAESARSVAEQARVTAEQVRQTDTATAITSATAATEAAQAATTAAQAATAAAEAATGDAQDATAAANTAAATVTDAVEHIADTVEDVLEEHPEWTTTVQDGSITPAKMAAVPFPDLSVGDALTSGAALSLTSPTAAESTWAKRVTDAVDGVAVVDAVLGNTVVWNQMASYGAGASMASQTCTNASIDIDNHLVTATAGSSNVWLGRNNVPTVEGHKYLHKAELMAEVAGATTRFSPYYMSATLLNGTTDSMTLTESGKYYPYAAIILVNTVTGTGGMTLWRHMYSSNVDGKTIGMRNMQVFDLTQMFGAGNEPSTVAEFERMFPEPYYPYDAGSLLSVNLTGVESVGFNQWDGTWENGGISTSGVNETYAGRSRCIGYIPVFPETAYYHNDTIAVFYYDANKGFISSRPGFKSPTTFTTPAGCHYIRFIYNASAIPDNTVCINISNPALNGTYRPYAKQQRTIPAATYFPNGMRSVGTVHDELTSDAAIVRVGAMDLGTLTWTYDGTYPTPFFHAPLTALNMLSDNANMISVPYTAKRGFWLQAGNDMCVASGGTYLNVSNAAYTDAATFKAAMQGVMLHYVLATPTTTPISPALTMTYRVEQGGTESVMHTNATAAPTWRIRYPLDLAATVMANIAPIENGTASTNYAVGSYLVHDGTLCKVTTAIATGEAITVGTNVTATTVMAELVALTQ